MILMQGKAHNIIIIPPPLPQQLKILTLNVIPVASGGGVGGGVGGGGGGQREENIDLRRGVQLGRRNSCGQRLAPHDFKEGLFRQQPTYR